MTVYKLNESVPAKALGDLRESVGWNRMEKEYSSPMMTSFCRFTAYDGGRLIGYIDCVSNGVTDAYIQDLIVSPDFQGKGIGTELMNMMIKYLKDHGIYMISVVYEDSLKPFYQRFGFNHMNCGQLQTYREENRAADKISKKKTNG